MGIQRDVSCFLLSCSLSLMVYAALKRSSVPRPVHLKIFMVDVKDLLTCCLEKATASLYFTLLVLKY